MGNKNVDKDIGMIYTGDRLFILAGECNRIAREHGWWEEKERNAGEVAMLIVTEVAEAFEEIRDGHSPQEVYTDNHGSGTRYTYKDLNDLNELTPNDMEMKPEGWLIELADVFIRIMDVVEQMGLSSKFIDGMRWKMNFNESRPYRHGGKTA